MKKAKLIKAKIIKIERGSHTVHTFEDDNDIEEIKDGAKLKVNVDGKEHEGCLIPFEEGKKEYHVTVYMG